MPLASSASSVRSSDATGSSTRVTCKGRRKKGGKEEEGREGEMERRGREVWTDGRKGGKEQGGGGEEEKGDKAT